MNKQVEPRSSSAAAPLDDVRQTVQSDLEYVSLQMEGKTYGGWYRTLPDGRMELLALANMHCERRAENSAVEQARAMLAEFIRSARPNHKGNGAADSIQNAAAPTANKDAVEVETPSMIEIETAPGSLGALLYADSSQARVTEDDWVELVRAVAAGDGVALHRLFERTQRVVFTLMFQFVHDRVIAEELTLDVFQDVWRQASQFNPAHETVLAWVMNLARFRAITWLEAQTRASTSDSASASTPSRAHRDAQSERLRAALARLTPEERMAIEAAYFLQIGRDEIASTSHQSVDLVTAQLRSGLDKLRDGFTPAADAQ